MKTLRCPYVFSVVVKGHLIEVWAQVWFSGRAIDVVIEYGMN